MKNTFDTKSILDIDIDNKIVICRVDYNVPFNPSNGEISDDSRIIESLPTINHLLKHNCRIVLCSHLGRPKGQISDELKMEKIYERVRYILNSNVKLSTDSIGPTSIELVENLRPKEILLLENLRFHKEEESNDLDFAKQLASFGELYVNDAFGVSHRSNASVDAITNFLPSYAGLLMQKEINMLNQIINLPELPFTVILGGSKVSDKISVIENLKRKANTFVIGGGMAATFIYAYGYNTGKSMIETDHVKFAKDLILESNNTDFEMVLPVDVIVSEKFSIDSTFRTTLIDDISENEMILDIGPQTSVLFAETLNRSKTLLWNGPMGVFEFEQYSNGTKTIANKLSQLKTATTIVGGGSTAEIIRALNLHEKVTHVSTGGGATLEFLGGETLPGISSLLQKDKPH
tara:strand:+ start:1007 stop:2221 length:1215 start_codon:yes stop_codon:yes gene_type:complete